MKNIGYKLVKNNTQTAEAAPYVGMAIPVGSLAYDNILNAMLDAGTFMTAATAAYFLRAFFEFAAEKIGENAVRVSTGTVTLYPAISGSFPSEDAPFDPLVNTLYVGASVSQDLRNRVAGVAPDYCGADAGESSVKLASVMDIESETMGIIDGAKSFRLAGVNLTVPDGVDESLTLITRDGMTKVCDITVSENDGGLYLVCALPNTAAIAKGTYKIRLVSHGLDPTDPLVVRTLTVTLVSAVVPQPTTIAKMRQQGMASDDLFSFGTAGFTITGTNLALGTGDKVTIELWDGTTKLASNEAAVASSTATTIVNTAGCEDTSGIEPIQWEQHAAKLVVIKNGTRIEHAIVVNA